MESIESLLSMVEDSKERGARGEIVLLSSPLAGYGKSHLIGRLSRSLGSSVMTVPLSLGPTPAWEDLVTGAVTRLAQSTSSVPLETSSLEEAAARFLSLLILSGMKRGILHADDCPVSLSMLENDYQAAFSHRSTREMVAWLKGKLALLSADPFPAGTPLGEIPSRDLLFWSRYFLKYVSGERRAPEIPVDDSEEGNRERFLQLLQIASSCRPLLLVADHLDSCHGSDSAGMKIVNIVSTIAERIPSSLILFSVNRDVWETVFEEKLPSAFLDRLTRNVLGLDSISAGEARQLIIDRLYLDGLTYHKSHLFAAALSRDRELGPGLSTFHRDRSSGRRMNTGVTMVPGISDRDQETEPAGQSVDRTEERKQVPLPLIDPPSLQEDSFPPGTFSSLSRSPRLPAIHFPISTCD